MKLSKKYLSEIISEILSEESAILSEIEENFGATAEADVLEEAWDSGWPQAFEEIRSNIKDSTTKGKNAEDIISKYFLEGMVWRFLNANQVWTRYRALFSAFTTTYFRVSANEPQKMKAADEFYNSIKGLSRDARQEANQSFQDALLKSNMSGLRALNKLIKSLNKRVAKFLDAVGRTDLLEDLNRELSISLNEVIYQEINLTMSKILDIIRFVEDDRGDNNTKKLIAFYKKIKRAADVDIVIDPLAIMDEVNIIPKTLEFIEDETLKLDMTPCEETGIDGNGCVLHDFDDGYFWYSVDANECSLSARKMNNCGRATEADSTLYNLMSDKDNPKWHVMVEYNAPRNQIEQVLGQNNMIPKEKYWEKIKWFVDHFDGTRINPEAWEHVERKETDRENKINNFLISVGLRSNTPLTDEWNDMVRQMNSGFYDVSSFEGDIPLDGDRFSRIKFGLYSGEDKTIQMSIRIRKELIDNKDIISKKVTYQELRDHKVAAKQMEGNGIPYDDYFKEMIPNGAKVFFEEESMRQRVRVTGSGDLHVHLIWVSKPLQNLGDSRASAEQRNELQRKMLSTFMLDTKAKFTVEAMDKVIDAIGVRIERIADNTMKYRKGLYTEKINKLDKDYLTSVILEVLKNSSDSEK